MGVLVTARKARLQLSSSSEASADEIGTPDLELDGTCSIDYYFACQDEARAAPGSMIPVLWPYDSKPCNSRVQDIAAAIHTQVVNALERHKIEMSGSSLRRLIPSRNPATYQDTLILETEQEGDKLKWNAAATTVQRIINHELRKRESTERITVEIRNFSRMYRETSSALDAGSLEYSALNSAKKELEDGIHQELPDIVTTISFCSRGKPARIDGRTPTVLIGISQGKRWDFARAYQNLCRFIGGHLNKTSPNCPPIVLEMYPNDVLRVLSEELRPAVPYNLSPLAQKLSNGSSIGPRASEEVGSVGIFAWYQPPGNAPKVKCFLTCYHVIEKGEEDKSKRILNHIEGIGLQVPKQTNLDPSDPSNFGFGIPQSSPSNSQPSTHRQIIVDYPAPFDARYTMDCCREEVSLKTDHDKSSQRTLTVIQDCQNEGGIGHVICASGYQLRSRDFATAPRARKMDWALVAIGSEERSNENIPPSRADITRTAPGMLTGINYETKAQNCKKIGRIGNGDWVTKNGRTTAQTYGEIADFTALVKWSNWREQGHQVSSKEVAIMNLVPGLPFCGGGDSGAAVFNSKKEWIGILHATESSQDRSYITPAVELLEDIEQSTGGGILTFV